MTPPNVKPLLGSIPWLPPGGFTLPSGVVYVLSEDATLDQLRSFWRSRGITGPVSTEEYWKAWIVNKNVN